MVFHPLMGALQKLEFPLAEFPVPQAEGLAFAWASLVWEFLGVVVPQAEAAPHQVSPRGREFPAHLAMAALVSLVIWVSVQAVPPQVAVKTAHLLALPAETQSGPPPLVAPQLQQAYPQGENRSFPRVLVELASV